MILSPAAFATGGTANDMQGFSLSGESLDICGLALRPNGEASTIYENAGMKLLVPLEFDNLLIVDTPQDNTLLFTVCEKASVEADMAQGGSGDGAGWLFSIGALSEIQLYELLCYDMSGIEIFARDAEGIYYAYYHPTDVRFVRESYEGIGDGSNEGWKQWSALNEWAWGNVRKTFIAENDGLSAETYNNSELGIFLARAAFTDDLPYTVSTTEYGPMTPNGVYAEPYVMRLLRNTHVEFVNDTEAPDGEYVVLSFPDDDYRFDFFLAEAVAKLVVFNACVALYPVPGYVERRIKRIPLHPKLLVLYRLFVCGFPALGLPAVNPLSNSVFYILAVNIYSDVSSRKGRSIFYNRKPRNCSAELHLVVCSHRIAATELFYNSVGNNNNTPAARARVSRASAICINDYIFHVRLLNQYALCRRNGSTTALVNANGFADGTANSLKSGFYFVVVAAATDCIYV